MSQSTSLLWRKATSGIDGVYTTEYDSATFTNGFPSFLTSSRSLYAMRPLKPLQGDWSTEELSRFFWLSPDDLTQVRTCRGAANAHELSALPALTEQTRGTLVGDRSYWFPKVAAQWQQHGVEVPPPYRAAKRDPHPRWSARLSRVRYRIDTVFGQLVDRCAIKRVWARDLWHHLSSRLLRTALMHTFAVLLNIDLGNPPLQLARVVAS